MEPLSSEMYIDDRCRLRSQGPSGYICRVLKTWRDVDERERSDRIFDVLDASTISPAQSKHFKRTGEIPRDCLLLERLEDTVLVHESELELVERQLVFGDFVKRTSQDFTSGTVIATSSICDVIEWCSADDTTHVNVPADRFEDVDRYFEGDWIVQDGFLGRILAVVDRYYIGLDSGSVIKVDNVEKLEHLTEFEELKDLYDTYKSQLNDRGIISGKVRGREYPLLLLPPDYVRENSESTIHQQEARLLRQQLESLQPSTGSYVGFVQKKKPNGIRRRPRIQEGEMLFGRILDVQLSYLSVEWIYNGNARRAVGVEDSECLSGYILFSDGEVSVPRLPVIHFDRNIQPFISMGDHSIGYKRGSDLEVGDLVRGLASDASPSSAYFPDHLKTYQVVRTKTSVKVQWQDLSVSNEDSTSLVPYEPNDFHEEWPGYVVRKRDDAPQSSSLGIIQDVSSSDRMANVRFFVPKTNEPLSDSDDKDDDFLAGDDVYNEDRPFGALSKEPDATSLFEIKPDHNFNFSRGDVVVILQSEGEHAHDYFSPDLLRHLTECIRYEHGLYWIVKEMMQGTIVNTLRKFLSLLKSLLRREARETFLAACEDSSDQISRAVREVARNLINRAYADGLDPCVSRVTELRNQWEALQYTREDIDWFGEIVDLDLAGNVTVRLCAAKLPHDRKVPFERLMPISAIADEYDDMEDSGEDYDSSVDEEEAEEGTLQSPDIIEEVLYEGGAPLDSNNVDDIWLTENDDDSITSEGINSSGPSIPDFLGRDKDGEEPMADLEPSHEQDIAQSNPVTDEDAIVSSPPRFLVLEEIPPSRHHFHHNSPSHSSNFMRRIQRENRILSTSLPENIYVRTWESRLDLVSVLIIGTKDTPYEHAPFVFDFFYPPNFPYHPPQAFFRSWTYGMGRINPNLYQSGKVCLSLLGTWTGEGESEEWSPASTMLQVLVSLVGLVMNAQPFYNEAGFEVLTGSKETRVESEHFNQTTYVLAKGFVYHALRETVQPFDNEIRRIYLGVKGANDEGEDEAAAAAAAEQRKKTCLLRTVVEETQMLVRQSEASPADPSATVSEGPQATIFAGSLTSLSTGARRLLMRYLPTLEELLQDG